MALVLSMAKSFVKVVVTQKNDSDFERMLKENAKLKNKPYVEVGVLGGEHHPEGGEGAEMSNIALARIHEYGTDKIPERSFIRSTVFEQKQAIIELITQLKTDIYKGRMTVDKALDGIGSQVESLIKGKITDGDPAWDPLSEETIKRKGSAKPLIDTGQLLHSITYKKVIK